MAIRTIDDSILQGIAEAIQAKDGGGTMTVEQMPTRIATIPTQDNALLYSLINRSITSIENSEVTSIGYNAFRDCANLTSVSFPNVTSINPFAFRDCANLTSVSFPNVTSIGYNAFQNCANLTSVSFPNVTSIGPSAFQNCANLTSVSFPNVTGIGYSAFQECTNLTSVSFPNVTDIRVNAFLDCTNLTIVILGKRVTLSNSNAFSGTGNAIIYVQPEDLSWYSTATNWSVLYTAGRVKSIEELPT